MWKYKSKWGEKGRARIHREWKIGSRARRRRPAEGKHEEETKRERMLGTRRGRVLWEPWGSLRLLSFHASVSPELNVPWSSRFASLRSLFPFICFVLCFLTPLISIPLSLLRSFRLAFSFRPSAFPLYARSLPYTRGLSAFYIQSPSSCPTLAFLPFSPQIVTCCWMRLPFYRHLWLLHLTTLNPWRGNLYWRCFSFRGNK